MSMPVVAFVLIEDILRFVPQEKKCKFPLSISLAHNTTHTQACTNLEISEPLKLKLNAVHIFNLTI